MATNLKAKALQHLEEVRSRTLALIEGVAPDELERATAPNGWTARDVLAHLALSEADHRMAIDHQDEARQLAEGGFDLDAWNARRLAEAAHLSISEILDLMARERATTLALLQQMDEADLTGRIVFHPVFGDLALGKVFRIIAYHERMHHADLAQALGQQAGDET